MRKKNYYSESLKLFWKNKLAVLSLLILVILAVSAILAPVLTPYDPNKQVLADKLLFPSSEHLFGTDEFGRDILTRCLYGCRVSLSVGLISQLIASVIGYFMGVCAGYFGKKVDDVISFLIQVFSSFPALLFAMARLIRGTVLQLKEQEYIQACRIDGGSSLRIILKHLFPNCIPMLIVSCTLGIPSAILTEASLSYLGLGVPSPTASWGSMISGAQTFIRTNTYYSLFPGLCIILTVIAFNTLGDGLRDVLDPKLRK